METGLLEKARESLKKQMESAAKKYDKIEDDAQAEAYRAIVEKNLGIFAEVIAELERREKNLDVPIEYPEPVFVQRKPVAEMSIKEVRFWEGDDAARAESLKRAMDTQPDLFIPYEPTNAKQ
jgi:hypothetical protein